MFYIKARFLYIGTYLPVACKNIFELMSVLCLYKMYTY